MGVADADDGMSAVQIQILLALVVPHLATLALDDVHVKERIYVE